VLGVPVTDRRADFFACGGTSLLAARLISRIDAAAGIRPSLGDLLREPTLAGQAALIEAAQTEAAVERPGPANVGVLSDQPAGATLVLFHPVGGGLLCYRQLVAALPGPPCVLGVQSPPPGEPGETIEGLAQRYADELSARLRPAPDRLVLAGWSMGGVLALETAHRLRAAGHDIDRVVAIDSYVAADPGDTSYRHDGDEAVRTFLTDLHSGPSPDSAVIPAELSETFDRYLLNYRALLRHRPAPPAAPTDLVHCAHRAGPGFPGLRPLDEVWAARDELPPGVRVCPSASDHYSVMTTGLPELAALLVPDQPDTATSV
jgi:surfactin synthase thioesterase subunit